MAQNVQPLPSLPWDESTRSAGRHKNLSVRTVWSSNQYRPCTGTRASTIKVNAFWQKRWLQRDRAPQPLNHPTLPHLLCIMVCFFSQTSRPWDFSVSGFTVHLDHLDQHVFWVSRCIVSRSLGNLPVHLLRGMCLPLPFLCQTSTSESFYGSPPNFSFKEFSGFETSLVAVSPETQYPSPSRRHRSTVLCCKQETCGDMFFIASFLVSSSHGTFVK